MAPVKRVRWDCPNGLHAGVLGPSRPRKNATVRFCLACSAEAGVLVERVAPAVERQRAAKMTVRQTRAQRERERQREQRENALKVTVLDYADGEVTLDAGELLKAAWRTREMRTAAEETWARSTDRVLPRLTIRRGSPDRGRAARPVAEASLPVRARDTMSGHAKTGGYDIVLTIAPGLGREWLEAIVVHEAAHMALGHGAGHGSKWRGVYIRTMRELYGVTGVRNEGPAWRLDERITDALRTLKAAS